MLRCRSPLKLSRTCLWTRVVPGLVTLSRAQGSLDLLDVWFGSLAVADLVLPVVVHLGCVSHVVPHHRMSLLF